MERSHVERGRLGETIAACFLELRGFRIVERNPRFGHLEIDLVARRGRLVAIVEVKYRASGRAGGAAAQIGERKRRDLETAAVGYLRRRNLRGVTIRFDVVTLDDEGPGALRIRHLAGAFPASGRYRL